MIDSLDVLFLYFLPRARTSCIIESRYMYNIIAAFFIYRMTGHALTLPKTITLEESNGRHEEGTVHQLWTRARDSQLREAPQERSGEDGVSKGNGVCSRWAENRSG